MRDPRKGYGLAAAALLAGSFLAGPAFGALSPYGKFKHNRPPQHPQPLVVKPPQPPQPPAKTPVEPPIQIQETPEPATLVTAAVGAGLMAVWRYRRRKKAETPAGDEK